MTEKSPTGLEQFRVIQTGKHGVSEKEKRQSDQVPVYTLSPKDKEVIARLEDRIKEIRNNFTSRNVIMTPEDKQRVEEKNYSIKKAEMWSQDVFGDSGSDVEVRQDKIKKMNRFGRFVNAVKTIFVEPRRLRSLLGAGIATVGMAHSASVLAESTGKVDTTTTIETEGEIPSQQLPIETVVLEEKTITPSQAKEAILNRSGDLSPEYLEAAKNIFEQTEKEKYAPFEEKLRKIEGAKEERIPFGARVWYSRNNSWSHADGVAKFQNHVGEADIIDYVKGGKNPNVICDKEGVPRVWVVVEDEKYEEKAIKLFKESIKWLGKNKMPDMLESASENGLCVFFVANTDPDRGPNSVWLNQWGVVCLNQSSQNIKGIKDLNLRNQYLTALIAEPPGIISQQLTTSLGLWDSLVVNSSHSEVTKSLIAGYVTEELRGKDKDGIYESYADSFPKKAIRWAQQFASQGVTVDGPVTKKLLVLLNEVIRVPGFGTLENIDTYNKAISNW